MRTSCVEWEKARTPDGYGQKWNPLTRKAEYVHRLVWARANGIIPDGMCVLHHCDNPPCYNLDHLYLGTHKDNAQDRERRKRGNQPTGLANGKCKLSDKDVRDIRHGYALGIQQAVLADLYSVHNSTVNAILRRRAR